MNKGKPEVLHALQAIQYESREIKNAMLAGAQMALAIYGKDKELDALIATGDSTAQINALINQFLAFEKKEHDAAAESAWYVFDNLEKTGGTEYANALKGVLGVLTNCKAITADGFGCDATGNVAEDKYYNQMANGPVAEYEILQYYNETTGASGDDSAIGGKRIRVLMTKTPEGAPITITENNEPMLAAGAIKLIKDNPNLIWKLLTSVAIDPNTKKDTGPASIIRGTIIDIARGMGIAEFAKNGELAKNVARGNIQNYRHLMISAMEELRRCDIETVKKASEADIERYIQWINACILPAAQQEQIFSEGDLKSYLDSEGKALRGADNANNILTGSSVDIAQLRRYVQLLGKEVVINLHGALIAGSTTKHPRAQEILNLYSSVYYL